MEREEEDEEEEGEWLGPSGRGEETEAGGGICDRRE